MSQIKKIGVIALSCQVKDEEKQKSIKMLGQILSDKKIEVVFGKSVNFEHKFVATTKARVDDVHAFFEDKSISLIINLAGGYNCNEILEFLDYRLISKNPKYFVGYSDITSINLALFAKAGIKTINGTMMIDYCFDKTSVGRLLEYLENPKLQELVNFKHYYTGNITSKILTPEIKAIKGKNIYTKGDVIAANLSTFNLMLGTQYMPDLKGKILFLEYDKEENKALPSIQRMLWQIRQNDIFDHLAGLVFGALEPIVQNEELELNLSLETILTDVTNNYDFPVLYNLQFGHIYPSLIIQNGTNVSINDTTISCL